MSLLVAPAISPATKSATPSNPTGTSSSSFKTMGLAQSITPKATGKILVIWTGVMTCATALVNGQVAMRYGTGAAPTNGGASTGSAVGNFVTATVAATDGSVPFSLVGIVSGATVGTALWLDLVLAGDGTHTVSIQDLSLAAVELG